MPRSAPSLTARRVRALLRFGIFALVFLAPMPFGAVRPMPVATLEVFAGLLGLGAVWLVWREPGLLRPDARRLLVPALGLALLGLLQIVPLPAAVTDLLAPGNAEVRRAVGAVMNTQAPSWTTLSLSPADTLDATLRWFAYVLIGLTAAVSFKRRRHLRQFALVLAASGAFQGLYGSAEYLSGNQQIFGYVKKYFLDCATGTFINRNHFASYLAMVLPLAAAIALESDGTGRGPRRDNRLATMFKRGDMEKVFALLAALLVVLGIFLSYSRGGLLAALAGVAVFSFGGAMRRRRAIALALLFLLPAAFISWKELRAPGERFLVQQETVTAIGSRVPAWRAGIAMVPENPIQGSGYGTFHQVFRLHQPSEVRFRWTHLHNDWLQAMIEGGVVGFALVAWLGWACIAAQRRRLRAESFSPFVLQTALLAALVAIMFHSLFDFSLRIPAIAATAACLTGLTVGLPTRSRVLKTPGPD